MTSQETNIQVFGSQLGGHKRLLSVNNGFLIIKPCNNIEREFYENCVLHPGFAEWIPKYYGSLQLQGAENNVETIANNILDAQNVGEGISSQHANANTTGVDKAICIENLLYNFKKPCVMDLKLGTQLWGEDADEAKRQKLIKKAKETTAGSLGFQVVAYQVYQKSTDSYFNLARQESRKFTPDAVLPALAKFFTAEISIDHRRLIIERFLNDLESFLMVLEKQEIRLIGSSLLFVYEGDPNALTEALKKEHDDKNKEQDDNTMIYEDEEEEDEDEDDGDEEEDDDNNVLKITDLKNIDFAHSFFRKGVGKDKGALLGLNNTINYLKQILSEKLYH